MGDETTCSCLNWWYGLCNKLHRFVGKGFDKWGRIVYKRPVPVLVVSLILSLLLMAGFMKYSVYGQAERLFYPQDSQVFQDLERVEDNFYYYVQNEEFIVVGRENTNVLDKDTFQIAYDIHQHILKVKGLDEFCLQNAKNNCLSIDPFGIFPGNNFQNVSQKLFSALLDDSLVMSNGLSAKRNFPQIFGNFRSNPITGTVESNVLRVSYPVKFAQTRSLYERNKKVERKIIDYLKRKQSEVGANELSLAYNTVRGIDDSISQNTKDNFSLITVSIGSMILFCALGMLNLRHKIKSHVLLSLMGIVAVIFGIGAGFGLGLLIGQPYVGFIGVLPFLVLGIGIDDMFIIIHHLDHQPSSLQGPDRLGAALKQAGFSILMTTLTDMVAFVIGTVSTFPAVQIFCTFAFLSILFSFLMILTFWLAVVAFDMKRIQSNRWDCLPCFHSNKDKELMYSEKEERSFASKVCIYIYVYFCCHTICIVYFPMSKCQSNGS